MSKNKKYYLTEKRVNLFNNIGDGYFFTKKELKEKGVKKIDDLIKRLVDKGFIGKLKGGVYFIFPLREFSLGYGYMPDWKHCIQFIDEKAVVSHGAAFRYWDLADQLYCKNIVTINKLKTKKVEKLGDHIIHIVYNKDNNDFGIEVGTCFGREFLVTDIERTLLDCFSKPELCIDMKEVCKGYYNSYLYGELDFNKLNEYLKYYKNKSKLQKILGYLADLYKMKVPKKIYNEWLKKRSDNYIYFDNDDKKNKAKCLKYNHKWRIKINQFDNLISLITH